MLRALKQTYNVTSPPPVNECGKWHGHFMSCGDGRYYCDPSMGYPTPKEACKNPGASSCPNESSSCPGGGGGDDHYLRDHGVGDNGGNDHGGDDHGGDKEHHTWSELRQGLTQMMSQMGTDPKYVTQSVNCVVDELKTKYGNADNIPDPDTDPAVANEMTKLLQGCLQDAKHGNGGGGSNGNGGGGSNKNLGLILGLSLGIGIPLLILIIYLIVVYMRR